MTKNYIYRILLAITIILVGLTFYVYWNKFSVAFSENSGDWGNFGSYVAGTLGIVLSTATLIFLYFTFREQQVLNNQQHFETTFFNLLKVHQDVVGEASDHINEIAFSSNDTGTLKSYELLEFFREIEAKKIEVYYKNIYKRDNPFFGVEEKHLWNYNPINNNFVYGKDYLIAITESIIEIYLYIKETAKISENLKVFYYGILIRSLRKSEKFFLIVFYLQKKTFWEKRNSIGIQDIERLCGIEKKLKNYLQLSEMEIFPFLACGLFSKETNMPESEIHDINLVKETLYRYHYGIGKFDDNDIEVDEISFCYKESDSSQKEIVLPVEETIYNYTISIGKLIDKLIDSGILPEKPGYDRIKAILEEKPTFSIHIACKFKYKKRELSLHDRLDFKLVVGYLSIYCSSVYNTNKDILLHRNSL